jgi:hypothetical protein
MLKVNAQIWRCYRAANTERGISGVGAAATSRARAITMGHLAGEPWEHVTVGKPGSPSASRSGSGRCTVACLELSGAPAPPSSAFPVIVGQSLHSQTTQLQRSEA